jgi:hypothetical protein
MVKSSNRTVVVTCALRLRGYVDRMRDRETVDAGLRLLRRVGTEQAPSMCQAAFVNCMLLVHDSGAVAPQVAIFSVTWAVPARVFGSHV